MLISTPLQKGELLQGAARFGAAPLPTGQPIRLGREAWGARPALPGLPEAEPAPTPSVSRPKGSDHPPPPPMQL